MLQISGISYHVVKISSSKPKVLKMFTLYIPLINKISQIILLIWSQGLIFESRVKAELYADILQIQISCPLVKP